MPPTEFLFIGGSADGRRLTLDHPFEVMKIPAISQTRACPADEMTEMEQLIDSDIYFRRIIRAGAQSFFYYRFDGMTDEEVIQRLLDLYRPPASNPLA